MESYSTRIIAKIAELVRRPVAEIHADRPLRELVHDSFMLVEMVVDLEDEFGVPMSQGDFAKVVTVRDLTELIDARLAAHAAEAAESAESAEIE